MIDKGYTFTVIGDDGREVVCNTLAIINRNEENKDPLIIYTDYTKDEEDKYVLYVSELKPEGDSFVLGKIDDEAYKNIPAVREAMEKVWESAN